MTSTRVKTNERFGVTERSSQVIHDPRLDEISPSNVAIEMNMMGIAAPKDVGDDPQAKSGYTIRSRPAAQAGADSPPSGIIRVSNEDIPSTVGHNQVGEPFNMTLVQERIFLVTLSWTYFLIGWNDSTLGPVSLYIFDQQGSKATNK